ncbi:tetratricopeptide repeat protein [Kitasatospora sp. NPDC092948]|uniref:tetratricopeptide repeat protein n=1 Tax=Kitasatospora sp. NPDC092948 TaxID=3364088 RepID=UPI00381D0CAE
MQDRVVIVDGAAGRGSGYLVGPRLVLSSRHVVGSARQVPVYRPGDGRTVPGRVVWCGSGRADAVLLRVEAPDWEPPGSPHVRWGEFVTTAAGQPCDLAGAPNVAQYEGKRGDPWGERKGYTEQSQERGTIEPGDGWVGDRYIVKIAGEPPEWPREGLPYGGLSGAAVLSGGHLVGVVAAEVPFYRHSRIEAVPAFLLLRDTSFREALARHGAGASTLYPADFAALADLHAQAPDRPGDSPAALLRPERESVPFRGREDLLADLLDWCATDGVAALLVHGPGGQGKTRLVRELAARLDAGPGANGPRWTTLWLAAGAEALDTLHLAVRPVLVVLDYAEERVEQLARLAESLPDRELPFKIVLIARTDGAWWDRARERRHPLGELLGNAAAVALPAADEERTAAYRHAVEAFADRLAHLDGHRRTDWQQHAAALSAEDPDRQQRLDHPAFGNMLTLHMTALADLLDRADGAAEPAPAPRAGGSAAQSPSGHSGGAAPAAPASRSGLIRPAAKSPDDVESRLLAHEAGHWNRVLAAHVTGYAVQGREAELFKDALAAATLLDARDEREADALLRRVRGLADDEFRAEAVRWLTAAYPPAAPGTDARSGPNSAPWGAVQPDRIAERFAGTRVLERPHLLPALTEHLPAEAARRLLTVLARAAHHRPLHARLAPVLTELCTGRPAELAAAAIAVATRVEQPAPLLAALTTLLDAPGTELAQLEDWVEALPETSHQLAAWAVLLTERVVALRRALPDPGPEQTLALAVALRKLGARRSDTADSTGSLAAVDEAIALLTPPAPDGSPPAHDLARRNALAGCHNNRSIQLDAQGRLAEALAAAEEAVDLFLALERDGAVQNEQHLLAALGTRAVATGELGDRSRALSLWREVVDRRRARAREDGDTAPEEHTVAFARALSNLAVNAHRAGLATEALAHAEEAVALLRRLAARSPDAHRSLLAHALGTLSNCLGACGRSADALRADEEAVALRRRLAAGHPAAYREVLARSLNSLAIGLDRIGRVTEGLAAAEESVRQYEQLAEEQPEYNREPLAMALNTWSNALDTVGRRQEAADAAERAAERYAELHAAYPDAHATDYAMALNTLGLRLNGLGRAEDSLASLQHAAAIYRDHLDRNNGACRPYFALTLNNLADLHSRAGRHDEALAACEEGVPVARELADANPDGHRRLLARLLTTRAIALHRAGRTAEVPPIAEEAVRAATPSAAEPESADMLDTLSSLLSLALRPQAAEAALRVVLAARRELVRIDPDRHYDDLLDTFDSLKLRLMADGETEQALAVAIEAADARRRQWQRQPTPDRQAALAGALAGLAQTLIGRDRFAEAAALAEESVELWQSLTLAERAAHRASAGMALAVRSVAHWATGRVEEVLTGLDLAAEEFGRLPHDEPARQAGIAFALVLRSTVVRDLSGPAAALPVLDRAVSAADALTGPGAEAYATIVADAATCRAVARALCEPPHPGALADAERGAALYRAMADPPPLAHADAVAVLSLCQARHHLTEQARRTGDEALTLARGPGPATSLANRAQYAGILVVCAWSALLTDRHPAARALNEEGIAILEEVSRSSPPLARYALSKALELRAELAR